MSKARPTALEIAKERQAIAQRVFLVDKIACSDWPIKIASLQTAFIQRQELAKAILSIPYCEAVKKEYLDTIDYLNSIIKEALFLGK